MYRMSIITAMIAVIVIAFYCKARTEKAQALQMVMAAASQGGHNSPDWEGVYRGVLPCADCLGIQKTVYLNKDLSYRVQLIYLGKGENVRQIFGRFSWNPRQNKITLKEPGEEEISYSVTENTLTQLDRSGNRITGELADKYILTKEKYALLKR